MRGTYLRYLKRLWADTGRRALSSSRALEEHQACNTLQLVANQQLGNPRSLGTVLCCLRRVNIVSTRRTFCTGPSPMVNSVVTINGQQFRVRHKKGPRSNAKLMTPEQVEAERLIIRRQAIMETLLTSKRPLDVELALRQNMTLLEPLHVLQAQQQLIEVASVYHPDIGGAVAAMEAAYLQCLPNFRPAQIAAGLEALAKVYDYRPSPKVLKSLVKQLLDRRQSIMPPHILPLLDFFTLHEYRNQELYRHLYGVAIANVHEYTVSQLSTILFAMCNVQGDPPGPLDPLIEGLKRHLIEWVDHPEQKELPEHKAFIARDASKLLWTLSAWESQPLAVMQLLLQFTVETWQRVLPHYQLMCLSGALSLQQHCWDDLHNILVDMRENIYRFKPPQLVELMEINRQPRSLEQKDLLDTVLRHLPIYLDQFNAEQLICVLRLSLQCRRIDKEALSKLQKAVSKQMTTIADAADPTCLEDLLLWQMESNCVDVQLADKAASAVGQQPSHRRRPVWLALMQHLHNAQHAEVADRVARKVGISLEE